MYNLAVKNSYYQKKSRPKKISLRKSKRVVFISLFILIVSLLFTAYYSHSKTPFDFKEITVKSGDTLWSIASTYNSSNEDMRKLISQVKKINNLSSAVLQPGQTIKIPE